MKPDLKKKVEPWYFWDNHFGLCDKPGEPCPLATMA